MADIKYKLKKGDTVQVISGKDKGKQGKILELDRVKGRVLVEGVNMVTKTVKKSQENPNGAMTTKEAFLHISNVMFFDSKSQKPSRLGIKRDENGKRMRLVKKSQEVVS